MRLFTILIGLSALLVACISAFFSVKGIGLLFSGAFISVIIMAASLEIGKVVATSFLYRYWKKTNILLKIYLYVAITILMAITSCGAFGFLSAAYQKSSSEFTSYTQKIQNIESQRGQTLSQIESAKRKIESLGKLREQQEDRLNKTGLDNNSNRRATDIKKARDAIMELVQQTTKEDKEAQLSLDTLITKIQDFDSKIMELRVSSQKSKDVLAFQFIADSLGLSLSTVVKWFILIIIAVFDPLAICLLIAFNVALKETAEESSELKKKVE